MRVSLLLAIVLIWYQTVNGKEISKVPRFQSYELASIKHSLQKRSFSDTWISIKKTADNAWDYINHLSKNTSKKFEDWLAKIQVKSQELRKEFKEHLNEMKNRVHDLIKNIMKTGDMVKTCLKERKEEIDEILKNILTDVTNCISNNSNNLKNFSTTKYLPIPNQTDFLKDIQSDVNVCLTKYRKHDQFEDCIQNIRKDIYQNITKTEESILQNHTEMRGVSEDVLNTIVECITNGIIKSTSIIVNETIQIIQCVSEG